MHTFRPFIFRDRSVHSQQPRPRFDSSLAPSCPASLFYPNKFYPQKNFLLQLQFNFTGTQNNTYKSIIYILCVLMNAELLAGEGVKPISHNIMTISPVSGWDLSSEFMYGKVYEFDHLNFDKS